MDASLRALERRLVLGEPAAAIRAERVCRRLGLPPIDLDASLRRRAPVRRLTDRLVFPRGRLKRAFAWALDLAVDGGPELLEEAWRRLRCARFPYFKPSIPVAEAAARALVDVRRGQAARFFTPRLPEAASAEDVRALIAELRGRPDHVPSREDFLALVVALPALEHFGDWQGFLDGRFKNYFECVSRADRERIESLGLEHINLGVCPVLFARMTDRAAGFVINLVALILLGLGLVLLGLGLKSHILQGGFVDPQDHAATAPLVPWEITRIEPAADSGAWRVEAERETEEARRFEVDAELGALLGESDGLLAVELRGRLTPLFPTPDAGPSTLKIVLLYIFGGIFALIGVLGLTAVFLILTTRSGVGDATWPSFLPSFSEFTEGSEDG